MIDRQGFYLTLILVLFAPLISAQEEEVAEEEPQDELEMSVRELEDTIVSASLMPQELRDAGRSGSVIDEQEISIKFAPGILPDILRQVPGVMLQKTGPSLGSPYIRGFTGFRTVLLIDGIRLNNSVFRDGPNQYWNTVDPLGLGRVELLRGPASLQHGSDAAGGTLAVYSADVPLGTEGQVGGGGRAYYRFNSGDYSHVGRVEGRVSQDGVFGARVGFSYKNFGDIDEGGGNGDQEGTSYDSWFLDGKVVYRPADDVELELLFQSANLRNLPRVHSTIDGTSYNGTGNGSDRQRDFDQDRDLVVMTARFFDGSFFEEAEFKLGWQQQDEEQHRIRSSGRVDRSGFEVDTLIAKAQFTSDTSIGTLVYGMDFYYDFVESFSTRFTPATGAFTEFAQGPVADDSTYYTFGLFVQDTIEFEQGYVSAGIRFTQIGVDAGEVLRPGHRQRRQLRRRLPVRRRCAQGAPRGQRGAERLRHGRHGLPRAEPERPDALRFEPLERDRGALDRASIPSTSSASRSAPITPPRASAPAPPSSTPSSSTPSSASRTAR